MQNAFRLGATVTIPGSDGAGHLGYAGMDGLVPFGADVYSRAAPVTAAPPAAAPLAGPSPAGAPPAAAPNPGWLPATGAPVGVALAGLALTGAAIVLRRRRTA